MSEKTKNLGLFKYIPETDGKQVFSIVQALNNNWDILDEKGAGSGFNLFDTKLVDHVLEGKEAEGWALQGTYVYKEAIAGSRYGYPDFYNKCLEEFSEATPSVHTLAGNDITLYTHSNGHMYYDISEKSKVDNLFDTIGMAWVYGVDTTEERIFLPRNTWFEQMATSNVGSTTTAGLPNIKGSVAVVRGDITSVNGCFTFGGHKTDKDHGGTGTVTGYKGLDFNASLSNSIYGKSNTVQPNSVKKLLYICVGTTISDASWVDVVTQVEGGVKDLEDKTNEGLEALSNASNALRQTQITNCLLEIPQRIKYTLEDGTLTIKAGSVVIVPYGIYDLRKESYDELDPEKPNELYSIGDTFIHENFKIVDMQFIRRQETGDNPNPDNEGQFFVWAEVQSDTGTTPSGRVNSVDAVYMSIAGGDVNIAGSQVSGSEQPTTVHLWYNTTSNKVLKIGTNGAVETNKHTCSLPLVRLLNDTSSGMAYAVGHVFNGIGYIASTVWVDKGVKALIPNGKNADGTLNNEIREVSELYTYNIPENMTSSRQYINLYGQLQNLKLATYGTSQVFMQENAPVCTNTHVLWLDTRANKFKYTENSGATWTAVNLCNIGIWNPYNSTGKLVHLQSNVLLSRGQSPEISSYSMPSSKYIDLTLGASGTTYTAPANGWLYVWKGSTAVGQYIVLTNQTSPIANIIYAPISSTQCRLILPLKKGHIAKIDYTLAGELRAFRFIYAEGEI